MNKIKIKNIPYGIWGMSFLSSIVLSFYGVFKYVKIDFKAILYFFYIFILSMTTISIVLVLLNEIGIVVRKKMEEFK